MNTSLEVLNLQFIPLIPLLWLVALILIAMLVLSFSIWKKNRGSYFRILLLASLIAALANPSLVSEKRKYINDTALVIVDRTQSQKINNREKQTDNALAKVIQKLRSFQSIDIQTITVSSPTISKQETVSGTQLFEARDRALKSHPPGRIAATIMITDGQIHDAPQTTPQSVNEAGPVHIILTGSKAEYDRVINIKNPPLYGIVGRTVSVAVTVTDQGGEGKIKTAIVTLLLDGVTLHKAAVIVGKQSLFEVTIPHGGQNFLVIQTEPLAGELSRANNKILITVNGIRDRLKVLLVSGEPHMGERAWRNILKSDPSVDLVHFTILRPPEKQDGTPINELSLIPFPIAELFEDKLSEFDLIIFDRYRRRGVLAPAYLKNIVTYVEEGGALLAAAGPSFATALSLYRTPLSTILPARPTGEIYTEGFIPSVSIQGQRHPVTEKLLMKSDQGNWGRWFRLIDTDPTAGNTLMTGPEKRPLLVLKRQKEGRIAQLLSDQAWLWGRGFEGGGPQAELLRRTAHWLMKEPELEEEQLAGEVIGEQLKITRKSLETQNSPVTLTSPDGLSQQIELKAVGPGRQEGTATLSQIGVYKISDNKSSTRIAVGPLNSIEAQDIRSTPDKVRHITSVTGGGIRRIVSSQDFNFKRVSPTGIQSSDFWLGLRGNKNYEITGYTRSSLFPAPLAIFVLLGFLCLAWWKEGR
ncbi:MAG: hypothetical protein JKY12_05130 [Sneathiella sp.]|nr:hypothetical protein [Sneathiella sp.]